MDRGLITHPHRPEQSDDRGDAPASGRAGRRPVGPGYRARSTSRQRSRRNGPGVAVGRGSPPRPCPLRASLEFLGRGVARRPRLRERAGRGVPRSWLQTYRRAKYAQSRAAHERRRRSNPRTPLPSSVSSLITRKCLAFVPSEAVVGLQVQGSTAETRELGLIFEPNWLGVDPRLSFLPCRATGLVSGRMKPSTTVRVRHWGGSESFVRGAPCQRDRSSLRDLVVAARRRSSRCWTRSSLLADYQRECTAARKWRS